MSKKFRRCEVELTDTEIRQKARRIAVVNTELDETEKEKAEISERVKGLKESRDLLVKQISDGKEWRDVEVIERINLDRRVVEILRADTGDRVDERPITEADQQGRLGFDDVDGTVREEKDELEGLGAAELRKRAKELGIKVPSKAKATEILALIRSAQPSSSEDVEEPPPLDEDEGEARGEA